MNDLTTTLAVRRVDDAVSIIALTGEVTGASETRLMEAYAAATSGATRAVLLDFSGLEYMNSSGIGLLVTLLVRANRAHQLLLAYGLSAHYRQILSLTRLDEAIGVHDTEAAALAAAGV